MVLWLNIAVQPCAIAMQANNDCPHCPPSHSEHHDTSDSHGVNTDMPCATGEADCNYPDDLNHDGRLVQVKLKDVPTGDLVVVGEFDEDLRAPQAIDPATVCPSRSPPQGSRSPLNVLYCVYLD